MRCKRTTSKASEGVAPRNLELLEMMHAAREDDATIDELVLKRRCVFVAIGNY